MAFQVLDEERIALLTEKQKKQYENELDMYHARSAFIEKVQILENAEIEPYEPKLQSIAVIDEIPEKSFHKPEYTVKNCAPASKPKTRFHTPEFQEPASVVLPRCTPIAEIKIGSIKKAEVIQPKLPRRKKAKPVAKTFEPIERNQALLSDIRRPNMDLVVLLEQAAKVPKTSPANIPRVSVPGAPAALFMAPEKTAPVLPEAAVNITGIKSKAIPKFEQPQMELPKAVKPSINAKGAKLETVQAILPELSNIEYTNTEFNRPEVPDAELPLVFKPDFAVREIQPLEHPALDLPSVGKPNVNVRTFKPAQHKQPELLIMPKIRARYNNFESIEKPELNVTVTPVAVASVKTVAKVEVRAKGLPIKTAVRIPDAQEALRELFAVKSDSEVLEETGS